MEMVNSENELIVKKLKIKNTPVLDSLKSLGSSAGLDLLIEVSPENREHKTLSTVGENTSLETAAHETKDTITLNDVLHGLRVRNLLGTGLTVGLDDTNGVRDRVRDDGRAETHTSTTKKLLEGVSLHRKTSIKEVVSREPGEVTGESGSRGSESTMEEDGETVGTELVHEDGKTLGTLDLKDGLEGIDRHEADSEESSSRRSTHGLDGNGEILSGGETVQESEGTSVGSSITETGERTLSEGRNKTLVETGNTTFLVKGLSSLLKGSTISVLVVHDGTHPHEGEDLKSHGRGTSDTTTKSSLTGTDKCFLQLSPALGTRNLLGLGLSRSSSSRSRSSGSSSRHIE